jgi:NAD(P)-dependent dehydrogenase (short-subunit alcohol dehydrogenase family)
VSALVTGAGTDLGKAAAAGLARCGAKVVIAGPWPPPGLARDGTVPAEARKPAG